MKSVKNFIADVKPSLLFTHVCPATGFCRCYAFQIGKICCRNCIVRNFQFRKFLPVNSYLLSQLLRQCLKENILPGTFQLFFMNYIRLHSNIFWNLITNQGFSDCKSGCFSLVIWSLGAESFYKSLIHFFCNLKIQICGKDSNICPVQSF